MSEDQIKVAMFCLCLGLAGAAAAARKLAHHHMMLNLGSARHITGRCHCVAILDNERWG